MPLSRRDLLRAVPFAAVPAFAGRTAADDPPFPGLVTRMREPQNLETPPAGLAPWRTPTEQFYVRNHFAVPKLDPAAYKLTVTGHVENPFDLTLKDLGELPAASRPLTLECAGNGRVFLTPPTSGLQWGVGGVGNAEWGGVHLGAVLDRAKVKPGAGDVVLVGADSGAVAGPPASPGPIPFDRGIPLAKAKRDEVLLATRMNGEPLTPAHGAPLRAVVGGWYGMAAVKWLTKVVVLDRPYAGFWQSLDYAYFERVNGLPSLTPITAVQPKAVIVSPGTNAVVPVGKPTTLTLKAWAGERAVKTVEVSTDGGKTWGGALTDLFVRDCCWSDWSFVWTPAERGPAQLVARCTDDHGNTQSPTRDPDRRTYMINHLVPVDVLVK